MVEETRRLLEHWRPGEALDSFAQRVQDEDFLGNATAYRTSDVVRRVFAPRFLRPNDRPARILKSIVDAKLPNRTFTELLFIFTSRFDPLIYDFASLEFWPSVRRGRSSFDTDVVRTFLADASLDGRLEAPWSDNVSVRIARCILGLLRDVGFLRDTARGRKEVVPYHMSEEGAAILSYELHVASTSDAGIPNHPDWQLFGLKPGEILELLDHVGEHRGLLVQRAGSVVGLTWFVDSIEDLINVLSR